MKENPTYTYQEAIDLAAQQKPILPDNDDPADIETADKPNPGKARKKAMAVLKGLMESDPAFAGLSMFTDGLHFYVPPPRAYYRAQIAVAVGFITAPDTLEQSSAELRNRFQSAVRDTDYSVGKNCCNKPMAQWQLEEIEQAYSAASIPLDTQRYRSISQIQKYGRAHRAGLTEGTPFRIDGVFVEGGIVVQERLFNLFKSGGYDVFKKDGKKITVLTVEALVTR